MNVHPRTHDLTLLAFHSPFLPRCSLPRCASPTHQHLEHQAERQVVALLHNVDSALYSGAMDA